MTDSYDQEPQQQRQPRQPAGGLEVVELGDRDLGQAGQLEGVVAVAFPDGGGELQPQPRPGPSRHGGYRRPVRWRRQLR